MSTFEKAVMASRELQKVVPNKINRILKEIAEEIVEQSDKIIASNHIAHSELEDLAVQINQIATLISPVGRIISSSKLPNDMLISKVTSAYGVIGLIHNSNPAFTIQGIALCLKSGNAVVISPGTQTYDTDLVIVNIIKEVLADNGINPETVTLEDTGATDMLNAVGKIDLIIPRGERDLVKFACENSRVPIIETYRGVCHTYIEREADIDKAAAIVYNAKTYNPLSCNALDTLVVHREKLADLPSICNKLSEANVVIRADKASYESLSGKYPYLEHASAGDYNTEFRGAQMAIKTAKSCTDALSHINAHSAKHSEAIVTENGDTAKRFISEIDAACLYHNVSTAFTDAVEFGMGVELGISTQKLGVRGPLSLTELTTYKYVITGDSQTR